MKKKIKNGLTNPETEFTFKYCNNNPLTCEYLFSEIDTCECNNWEFCQILHPGHYKKNLKGD